MPRRHRSIFRASPSRRPTGSLAHGTFRPIPRRFAGRSRLNVRRCAIPAHLRLRDPIDRSSGLVGTINPDGVAALAQAGERGPHRVRQPAGSGDQLGESRTIATLQQLDDLRDLGSAARRDWGRRDAAIGPVNGCSWVGTGFGLRIDGDDRMVRASFRLSFGGPSLVDRDRLRTRGGQLERKSLSGFVVAPPDRPSRLRPYLLHKPGFEKLGYGPLGLGALWTCRRNQAVVIALRRGAEQHKLRVVAYDGHV